MHVNKNDIVILIDSDQESLQKYIGTRWGVEAVIPSSWPETALISQGTLQATTFSKNLEVVPPADSPFEHGDQVKIFKPFDKSNYITCDHTLVGKAGKIKSYDSRIDYYFIKCPEGGAGWFPISSLIPLNFKGEIFYYPMQQVKYRDRITTISKIKKTRFNYGQLLLIEGHWVPSTDVENIGKKGK